MKRITLLTAVLFASAAFAGSPDAWYTGFPKALERSAAKQQLPDSHVFEIPLSQFASAEQLLVSRSYARIQNGYFGSFPHCPSGTVPYLTRAVFERTNNIFVVYTVGTNILVLGNALGPPEPQHRSALVLCLTFQPSAIYTATGGAL